MSSLPTVIPAHTVIPAYAGISGAVARPAEIPGQARDDVSWGSVIPAYAGISGAHRAEIPGQARDDGKVDR